MPFNRDADIDVFVSYAHADNLVPVGIECGWVTMLTRNLILNSYTAKRHFYIDHELETGDDFTEELMQKVDRCNLLLVVLSQNYVSSTWCGKEIDRFLEKRNMYLDRPRGILVVELSPFEELEGVPPNITKLRATLIQSKFWHRDPEGTHITLLGYPSPPTAMDGKEGYWTRLSALSQAISRKLPAQQAVIQLPTPQPPVPQARTVLLADVTDDLESERNAVKVALEKEGVIVVPEGDYVGLSFDEFQAEFQKDMARSELFVQLLSKTPGRSQAGFPGRMPRLQYDLAKQSGREILQWCDQEVPARDRIADSEHAKLFSSEHLRAVNLEAFKDEISDRLKLIEKRRLADLALSKAKRQMETEASLHSAVQPGAQGAARLAARAVFVDDEFGDAELAQRIREVIKSERCMIRSWPKTFPLGQEPDMDHEVLRICRGGLTLYVNKRDQVIVLNRLLYFLNRVAEERLPLAKWGVYFGPPKDNKESVQSDFGIDCEDVIGIVGMEQFNERELRSFLQSL